MLCTACVSWVPLKAAEGLEKVIREHRCWRYRKGLLVYFDLSHEHLRLFRGVDPRLGLTLLRGAVRMPAPGFDDFK